MIRIIFQAADVEVNTSWWRGLGPLIELERAYPNEFKIHETRSINWSDIRRADLIWFMHGNTDVHHDVLKVAKSNGCPVLVDWDDLIWEIPVGNWIRPKATQPIIDMASKLLMGADFITVSTPELQRYLTEHGVDVPVRVFPNMLCSNLRWPKQPPPQQTVLWRGGQTHDGDIAEFEDDVARLADEFPEWRWVWAGWDPWRLSSRIPQSSWSYWDAQPLADYHHAIGMLAPSIIMSPLKDSLFNRCKSKIGVYEAAIAGGTFVCADFDQLQSAPGALHYTHKPEGPSFIDTMRRAMREPMEVHRARAQLGRAYIDESERIKHFLPRLRSIVLEAISG